jgi:hypothetical protein
LIFALLDPNPDPPTSTKLVLVLVPVTTGGVFVMIKYDKTKTRNTVMILFYHVGGVGGVQQFYLGPRDMDIPDTQVS